MPRRKVNYYEKLAINEAKATLAKDYSLEPGQAYGKMQSYAQRNGVRIQDLAAMILIGGPIVTDVMGNRK